MRRKFINSAIFAAALLMGFSSCSKDDDETSQPIENNQNQGGSGSESQNNQNQGESGSESQNNQNQGGSGSESQNNQNQGGSGSESQNNENQGGTGSEDTTPEVKKFNVTLPDGSVKEIEENTEYELPAADTKYAKVEYTVGDETYKPGDKISVTADIIIKSSNYFKATFQGENIEEIFIKEGEKLTLPSAKYKVFTFSIDGKTYNSGDEIALSANTTFNCSSSYVVTKDEFPEFLASVEEEEIKVLVTEHDGYGTDSYYYKPTDDLMWNALNTSDKKIDLTIKPKEGVTEIGVNCFTYCNSITSITLMEGIETLEAMCLSWIDNLKSIQLPNGLKAINNQAFSGAAIETITIPSSVESMYQPFMGCKELKTITIEGSPYIYGIRENPNLESVVIKGENSILKYYAIEKNPKLTSITINGMPTIEKYAFGFAGIAANGNFYNDVPSTLKIYVSKEYYDSIDNIEGEDGDYLKLLKSEGNFVIMAD